MDMNIEENDTNKVYTFTFNSKDELHNEIVAKTYEIESLVDNEEIAMSCMMIRGIIGLLRQTEKTGNAGSVGRKAKRYMYAPMGEALVSIDEVAKYLMENKDGEFSVKSNNLHSLAQSLRRNIRNAHIPNGGDITGAVAYAKYGFPSSFLPKKYSVYQYLLRKRYPFMDSRTAKSATFNGFCSVAKYRPGSKGNFLWGYVGTELTEETFQSFKNYLASLPAIYPFADKHEQELYLDVLSSVLSGEEENDIESVEPKDICDMPSEI